MTRIFEPSLFIGIGATGAYFTLRETVLYYPPGGGSVVSSIHWRNLSQDANEAIEKAKELASKHGLKLVYSKERMETEMREILHATADEIAERERKAQEQLDREQAQRDAWELQCRTMIAEGKFPLGKYFNRPFTDATVSYLNWMMDTAEEKEGIARELSDAIIASCGHLRFPVPDLDKTVGMIGKREEFDVTAIRAFTIDSAYGHTNVVTLVTDDGACIQSFGKFAITPGERIRIKATVKEYKRYKGQMQTVVNRIAKV